MVDYFRRKWISGASNNFRHQGRLVSYRADFISPITVDEAPMSPEFAKEIYQLPEPRRQLLFRIRRQIAEGSYDTDEKLELALDRMIDRISGTDVEDDAPPESSDFAG